MSALSVAESLHFRPLETSLDHTYLKVIHLSQNFDMSDQFVFKSKANCTQEKERGLSFSEELLDLYQVSSVPHRIKNLPAQQKTWIPSMGQEDPLGKGMTTHSSIVTWRISWKRSLKGCSPWDHKELDVTEWLTLSISIDL